MGFELRGARTFALALGLAGALSCVEFQRRGESLGPPPRGPGRYVRGAGDRSLWVTTRQGESTSHTPVLLVHGFASNQEVWTTLEPSLRRTRRTIAVDLPGFGHSERFEGDYSPAAIAADLRAMLDSVGVFQVDIVAHSWGSSVTLAFALAYPTRVRRMVLFGAWIYDEQIPPFFRWAREPGLGEGLFTLFYRERPADRAPLGFAEGTEIPQETVDAIERSFDRPGTVRAALAAVRGQYFLQQERRYRSIAHPTLLIYGAEDSVARPRFGARLANELQDARLQFVPRAGHFPMFESAGTSRALVLSFLDEEGSAPPAPAPAAEGGAGL